VSTSKLRGAASRWKLTAGLSRFERLLYKHAYGIIQEGHTLPTSCVQVKRSHLQNETRPY
jgi:hypothetical protein